jgi:4-hydroxy-3-methylbut-2-en-1-yl diphosphate reductase
MSLSSTYPTGSYHIKRIKESAQKTFTHGRATFHFPSYFGFCHGVDRAIQMINSRLSQKNYSHFYLLGELIHNPRVNNQLKQQGVISLPYKDTFTHLIAEPSTTDVFTIPAFGINAYLKQTLKDYPFEILDTTCPSVRRIFTLAEEMARNNLTLIIHGKKNHEETQNILSYYTAAGGVEAVVIETAHDVSTLSDFFSSQSDSKTIGLLNQTTMLASETKRIIEKINGMIKKTRHKSNIDIKDTLCLATQKRQDSLQKLTASPLDFVLIVGGFNSSNSISLAQSINQSITTYHIQGIENLSQDRITYRDPSSGTLCTSTQWLSEGMLQVGICSGASTPDSILEEIITAPLWMPL